MSKACIELLRAPWFEMFENLSAATPSVRDLTIRQKNQLVENVDFTMGCHERRSAYKDLHVMEDEIETARRIAVRQLLTRFRYSVRTCATKNEGLEQDKDTSADLLVGLKDADCLSKTKMMGALLHPLFNSKKRMLAAGLCTDSQYDAGLVELLELVTDYYTRLEGNDNVIVLCNDDGGEWDDDIDESADVVSPAARKASDEWKKYCTIYKHSSVLPEVKPHIVLGGIDKNGQPRKPIIAIGPVVKCGKNLPSGRNHGDYVNGEGSYDIVAFFQDHCKQLPGLNNAMGKVAPHSTSEANCESLFSESGHLAKPHMNRTANETFERLVIAKHRMSRIYCSPAKVKEEFLRRWKGKLFGKDEDRDDLQFWEQEKSIFLEEFPQHRDVFDGMDGGDVELVD